LKTLGSINKRPFCTVVIPAFNEEVFIKQCLSTLVNQSYPRDSYEIIVVDNGSTDSTVNIANNLADKTLSLISGNVGAVRNYGISQSAGEIIICTDADCLVSSDWIQNGVNLLMSRERSVFGGGLKPGVGASWVEKSWLLNDDGETIQQNDLMGSCIFIWKSDLVCVGLFDEKITAGEDSDLSARLKENTYSVDLTNQLSLVHMGTPQKITEFIKRQIWHSENYFTKFRASLRDKVFILVVFYLLSIVSIPLILFFLPEVWGIIFVHLIAPLVLTLKRLRKATLGSLSVNRILQAAILDNFYLIGRSIGLMKGLVNKVFFYPDF
jgi:glycosyltransferase involved in cell wall biosynthesis